MRVSLTPVVRVSLTPVVRVADAGRACVADVGRACVADAGRACVADAGRACVAVGGGGHRAVGDDDRHPRQVDAGADRVPRQRRRAEDACDDGRRRRHDRHRASGVQRPVEVADGLCVGVELVALEPQRQRRQDGLHLHLALPQDRVAPGRTGERAREHCGGCTKIYDGPK